jgi:Amt family ammonium transporter
MEQFFSVTSYAPEIPELLFFIFQMNFAAITPALIVGAFAERIKFRSLLIFTVLWSTLIYSPVAHWIWGADGWLHSLGVIDFRWRYSHSCRRRCFLHWLPTH